MRLALLAILPTLAFSLTCSAQDVTTRWAHPIGTSLIPDGVVCDLAVLDDIDADGLPDLLVGIKPQGHDASIDFPDGFAEVRSGADGSLIHTIAPPVMSSSFGLAVVATDDLDGDGIGDFGVLRHVFVSGAAYQIQVLMYSAATGGFIRVLDGPLTLPPAAPTIAGVTDLNADGIREIAICSAEAPTGSSEAHFVDPLGVAPTAIIVNPSLQIGPTTVTPIADRDGDGQAEFVYAYGKIGGFQPLEIRSGADLGILGTLLPTDVPGGGSPLFGQHVRTVGDVNRDGNLDLIAPDNLFNTCRIIDSVTGEVLNVIPDGMTLYRYHQATGGLGDVDGDGYDDYYLIDEMSALRVFSGRFHRRQSPWEARVDLGNVVRSMAAVGDLNGDGFDDFAAGVGNEVRLMSLGGARRIEAQTGLTLNYRPFDAVAANIGELELAGGMPQVPGLVAVSLGEAVEPSPILIDTAVDRILVTAPFTTDALGEWRFGLNVAQPSLAGESLFVQAVTLGAGPLVFSDALELLFVGSRMSITSVAPAAFVPGESISVVGEGFMPGAVVFLDGIPLPTTPLDVTTLEFTVPANVSYDMELTVRNPSGETVRRTVNPPPFLNFVAPMAGPAAGGGLLIITGGPFVPGTTVTVGGTPMTLTSVSPTVVIGTTPPGTVGAAEVVVQVPGPGGGFTTLTGDYVYN